MINTVFFRAIVVLAAAASTSLALAAPSASDLATARTLYREGVDRATARDHVGAVVKLRAARDLVRTPIILLALAKSELESGQLVEAHETALEARRVPRQAAETPKSDEAREEAADLVNKIDARTPRLRVFAASGAAVRVDGTPLPDSSLGELRSMNPGKHTIAIAETTLEVELSEGEHRDVDLRAAVTPLPTPVKVPILAPLPKRDFYSVRKESPLVPLGFVVGGIAAFSGMVAGVVTLAKKQGLGCYDHVCLPNQWGEIDSARDWGNVTTGMFVVAGASFVTGIVGLVLTKRVMVQRKGLSVQPWAGPNGAGLSGSFE